MGKHGGKHKKGRAAADDLGPAECEAAVQKVHRKSKVKNEREEPSGPSKYLLSVTETDSAENKHALYQRAVQSPKGDISYLVKFFLTYVGGRVPLHLREDFCGTALICSEWLRTDARRTATGLDLDEDALQWGAAHNFSALPDEGRGRICLLLGNVLQPLESALEVTSQSDRGEEENRECESGPEAQQEEEKGLVKDFSDDWTMVSPTEDKSEKQSQGESIEAEAPGNGQIADNFGSAQKSGTQHLRLQTLGADIICAFNYSTCCLHSRRELLRYFQYAHKGLSKQGGVFAMDLYGGTSSESALRLKRRFGDFTYTWEQEEFDAVTRMTRISLHFRLESTKKTIKSAFSYQWRLWTIPEVRECLLEAGFKNVHVWMRQMPDLEGHDEDEELEVDANDKYAECRTFLQCDAWNSYIVASN